MRYRLRTLIILLAVLPPILAGAWWVWVEMGWTYPLFLVFVLPPILFLILPELLDLFFKCLSRK
jgi:hypothetical protein